MRGKKRPTGERKRNLSFFHCSLGRFDLQSPSLEGRELPLFTIDIGHELFTPRSTVDVSKSPNKPPFAANQINSFPSGRAGG